MNLNQLNLEAVATAKMGSSKYLVIFYGVSAGQNGENLGADEEDLVRLVFLVFNREENQVSCHTSAILIYN